MVRLGAGISLRYTSGARGALVNLACMLPPPAPVVLRGRAVIHRGAPAKLGDRTPYSTGPAPGCECAAAPATQPHRAAHTASRWHALSGLTVNLICDEQAAADSQVGLMMRRARHLLATAPQYFCLCARARARAGACELPMNPWRYRHCLGMSYMQPERATGTGNLGAADWHANPPHTTPPLPASAHRPPRSPLPHAAALAACTHYFRRLICFTRLTLKIDSQD
eukprot:COSAG01_NODE_20766_length_936_cov_3.670531_1_plen_224_part_00